MTEKTYHAHPLATAFPLMPKDEFKELKADIKKRGIRSPILVHGDQVIDGRNRLAAAEELGLKPNDIPTEEYKGADVVGEIIARNIMRRHLTADQRVAIVVKLRGPQLTKEADARMKHKGGPVSELKQGRTHVQIAHETEVGEGKAQAALSISKHAPGELENVIAGKQRLSEAHKVAAIKRGKPARPKKVLTLRQRVEKKFAHFMERFTPAEYRTVRQIVRELVAIKNGHAGAAEK